MMCSTLRTCPFFNTQCNMVITCAHITTGRTCLCGILWINKNTDSAMLCGTPFKLRQEHTPSTVGYGFCDSVVFHQISDFQIFRKQEIVVFNFSVSCSSDKVFSLVCHMFVYFSQLLTLFLVVPGIFQLSSSLIAPKTVSINLP